jgi:hypothetical protein
MRQGYQQFITKFLVLEWKILVNYIENYLRESINQGDLFYAFHKPLFKKKSLFNSRSSLIDDIYFKKQIVNVDNYQ